MQKQYSCVIGKLSPILHNVWLNTNNKISTRITCSSTSLIDHILLSLPELISQEGVIDVGLSDQLIYCTWKISRIRTEGVHKKLNSVHVKVN